jgi:CDP-diacylglycerol--glycerol-3-phosphate 3-phosphatidyltransferase
MAGRALPIVMETLPGELRPALRVHPANALKTGATQPTPHSPNPQEEADEQAGLGYHLIVRMNLPNSLTILRIFFVPLLVAALVQEEVSSPLGLLGLNKEFLALAIFLAAATTDLLDGYLARRWGQVTTVGTLLDPIADKLLVSAALISLVEIRRVPAWMVVLIIGREFAVSGLRSIAASSGYTIRASELGKTKMVMQVIAISLVLMSIHWTNLAQFASLAMWGVVVFGMVSAVDYFRKFWRRVDDQVKRRRRAELLSLERRKRRAEMLRTAGTTASPRPATGSDSFPA